MTQLKLEKIDDPLDEALKWRQDQDKAYMARREAAVENLRKKLQAFVTDQVLEALDLDFVPLDTGEGPPRFRHSYAVAYLKMGAVECMISTNDDKKWMLQLRVHKVDPLQYKVDGVDLQKELLALVNEYVLHRT